MTTDERIAKLENHIHQLQDTQTDLYKKLAQARVDQWHERIEDLELQVHLGAMGSNERLTELSEQLRNQWDRTHAQMQDASSTASGAADTLWTGLERAYGEVRQALLESRNMITH